MASFRMEVGALSAEQTASDAYAGAVIRHFAWATGAPVEATNQQLLNHAHAALLAYMVKVARQRMVSDAAAAAEVDAAQMGFKGE